MSLAVQTPRGDIDRANAYADLTTMRAHHAARGADLASFTDERISQALVLATDFMDARYSFVGDPLRALQGTACPRYLGSNGGAEYSRDIATLEPSYLLTTAQWSSLEKACCMLAYRELKKPGGLMPDPAFDASGQKVAKKTVKAGPVESTVEYTAEALVPSFPAVDLMLKNARVLRSRASGKVVRG